MPRVLDVAAQVPHCALRAYVLGERAHDLEVDARRDRRDGAPDRRGDARRRGRLLDLAHDPAPLASTASCRARTRRRRSCSALGRALGEAGHGVFEMVVRSAGPGARSVVDERVLPPHRPRHHLRAGADADAADGVARHAGARRRSSPRDGLQHRAAGAVPADRHALRPAELVAPVHLASDLLATSWPRCRSTSASRACATPEVRARLLAEEPGIEQPDRARC